MDLRTLLRRPVPDAETETELARAARAGDAAARSALVTSSLRLVAMRVVALGARPDQVDDALQEGAIALLHAVDRFDPDRGTRLATWAWPWITGAVRRSLKASVQVPVPVVDHPEGPDLDTRLALAVAWRGLAVPDREVLALRYGLGPDPGVAHSRAAVAQALGVGVDVVRTREGRAMRQLRRGLATVGDRAPLVGADPL